MKRRNDGSRSRSYLAESRTQSPERRWNIVVRFFIFVFQDHESLVAGVFEDFADAVHVGRVGFAVRRFHADFDLHVDRVADAALEVSVGVVADEIACVQVDADPVVIDAVHDLDHLLGSQLAVVFDAKKNPLR